MKEYYFTRSLATAAAAIEQGFFGLRDIEKDASWK